MTAVATRRGHALGTYVELAVTEPSAAQHAEAILRRDLDELDRACSRFRDDSDLSRVNAAAGAETAVGSTLRDAVRIAIEVAKETDGLVDPTLGQALIDAGYDRDFTHLPADAPERVLTRDPRGWDEHAPPAWEGVAVDDDTGTITVPEGLCLDLGATAKARGADLAAGRIAARLGIGVLVSLGGDIAIGGPPPDGGWAVRVVTSARSDGQDAETVSLERGGLATSSPHARAWVAGGESRHHIIDPQTRRSAPTRWASVSAVASTCVTANAATTAAIVLGDAAPRWLAGSGLPCRLVGSDGSVRRLGGWPGPGRWSR